MQVKGSLFLVTMGVVRAAARRGNGGWFPSASGLGHGPPSQLKAETVSGGPHWRSVVSPSAVQSTCSTVSARHCASRRYVRCGRMNEWGSGDKVSLVELASRWGGGVVARHGALLDPWNDRILKRSGWEWRNYKARGCGMDALHAEEVVVVVD